MNEAADIRYAGFWARAKALLFDMIFATPLYLALVFALPSYRVAEAIFIIVIIAAYTYFFSHSKQGTPGMQLAKVKVQTVQGERLSWQRALVWCVVSALTVAIVFAGMFYVQANYDLQAIQSLMWQMTLSGNRPTLTQLDELERLAGMSMVEFNAMMMRIFLITMGLCLIWAISVVKGSQKAGFHNWVCGVRFVKT